MAYLRSRPATGGASSFQQELGDERDLCRADAVDLRAGADQVFSALNHVLVTPAQALEGRVDHHSTKRVSADRAKKRLGT